MSSVLVKSLDNHDCSQSFFLGKAIRKTLIFILAIALFQVQVFVPGFLVGADYVVSSQSGYSDIPGEGISIGQMVKGIVDASTKPNHVYALSLTAGQQVRITIKGEEQGSNNDASSYWEGFIYILDPKSGSIINFV
jgi:hypothetical protein